MKIKSKRLSLFSLMAAIILIIYFGLQVYTSREQADNLFQLPLFDKSHFYCKFLKSTECQKLTEYEKHGWIINITNPGFDGKNDPNEGYTLKKQTILFNIEYFIHASKAKKQLESRLPSADVLETVILKILKNKQLINLLNTYELVIPNSTRIIDRKQLPIEKDDNYFSFQAEFLVRIGCTKLYSVNFLENGQILETKETKEYCPGWK